MTDCGPTEQPTFIVTVGDMPSNKPAERTQVDPNREGASIVVTNFTGLNTTSNPVTIPYEDSPIFTNVIVGERGGVERRKGTKVVYEPTNSRGGVVIPVTTSYGYNYLLTKDGTSVNVLEYSGTSVTQVALKQGVWSQAAADIKPSYVTLAEPGNTKVLLCTGVNAPIQVRFDEFRSVVSLAASGNLIVVNDAAQLKAQQLGNMRVYVDGSPRNLTLISTNSTNTVTLQVSGAPITPGNHVLDIISITWQWWAESSYYYGDRFFDTVNRAHAKPTDVHVPVPENLRDALDPLTPVYPFIYPLDVLYWNGSNQVYSVVVTNLSPTTAYQHTFSDGSQRLNTNAPANFAKSFVTFGSVDTTKPTAIETIYLLRRRKLRFRGGANGILSSNLHVSVDGVQTAQQSGFLGANGDYLLFASITSFSPAPITPPNVVDYISFGGGNPIGIPANAIARITNKEAIYAGINCTSSNNIYLDGSWVPCYGLGDYADYGAFSFPRVVELYQQRLVFSGFPHNPLNVALGSVSDSSTPGEFYVFFQQDAFTTAPTDPIDFTISSTSADDYVTSLIEHQGSLFIGTTQGFYRASATGRGPLEPGNVYVSNISSNGPLNADCTTKAGNTVLVLTKNGVFSLENGSSAQEATEYTLEEISVPVHDLFKKQPAYLEQVGWVDYDSVNDAVYIGLASSRSKQVATRLLRYGVFRGSWSELTTVSGWNTYGGSTIKDTAGNNQFILICARTLANGVPSNLTYVTEDPQYYLDFVRTVVSNGTTMSVNITPVPTTTHTITTGARYYDIGFDTIPIGDVYDIEVRVGNMILVPNIDFIKNAYGQIYLHTGLPNQQLTISYKNPSREDGKHFIVYADSVEQFNVTTGVTRPTGTIIVYGTTYQSVFSTPLFTWGTLFGNKRLLYWAGLFDNQAVSERWRQADVNQASGQNPNTIVDVLERKADCNISFIYDSDGRNVNTSSDLYNYRDYLNTDVGSAFDVDIPFQSEPEVLVKQSLQGVGYSFRCVVWECSDAYYSLLSYQIEAKHKGKNSRHWSE